MPADEIGSDAAAAGQRTRDLWESERQIRKIQGKQKMGVSSSWRYSHLDDEGLVIH